MQIVKRTGEPTEYSGDKIKNAIRKAMAEGEGVNEVVVNDIEWEIKKEIGNEFHQGLFTVEMISDMCEDKLLRKGFVKAGKRYILYRHERKNERESGDKKLKSKYFSSEFLKKYRYAKEPFEPLGAFVKARTYARWLPEESKRETWYETVKRAVEFNLSLAPYSQEEAEGLFDNVFNLRQNLSGRMTWLGGTPTSHSNALGLFNCAFKVIDTYESFSEAYTVLMLGAGLGVRVTKDDLSALLPIRQGVEIFHKDYDEKPRKERQEYTTLVEHEKSIVEIVVGDSRGGFSDALKMYFDILYKVQYKEIQTIIFNYDNVRPIGLRIHGFGGKSSGFKPLLKMFDKIHKITQNKEHGKSFLKTIDVFDIICIIAENVVSGNVRRSSIMTLCDEDDTDIINAKNNLYTQVNGNWIINEELLHRQMSNNTIIYKKKPSRERLSENFKKLRKSGEPATLNLEQALLRNPNAKGLNP